MRYRPLGNSGIQASVIGLGTWVTGGSPIWGEDPDDKESIRAIDAALDAGITLIDTAPIYGIGRSEEVVGRAIKGKRDQVVLATKCGLRWDDASGTFMGHMYGKDVYRNTRPDSIKFEIEQSLQRLDTTHIDLYQVHWPTVDHMTMPVTDTMATLMKLKDQGKIRSIGVSNVSVCELDQNLKSGDVIADQARYSILSQKQEQAVINECREKHIAFLAYQPLEQGLLTGKITRETKFADDDIRNNADWNPWFQPSVRDQVIDVLDAWDELTTKYDCTLAQLVLAWTVEQPGVTHALVGARNVQQAEANARGGEVILGDHDIDRMTADAKKLHALV
ncbi:aldo/keto reductase [Planctomycetota bacterium]|nr:aldo/keto reductase [Planctomycetota bacterium]